MTVNLKPMKVHLCSKPIVFDSLLVCIMWHDLPMTRYKN